METCVETGLVDPSRVATGVHCHSDRGHLALLDVFEWVLEVGGGDHHLRYVQLPDDVAMAECRRTSASPPRPAATRSKALFDAEAARGASV